jgi:hypothetical protein
MFPHTKHIENVILLKKEKRVVPSEEILKDFEQNVQRCAPMLKQLSAEIIKQEVSNYPIFIACDEPVNMGKIIFIRGENEMNDNILMFHIWRKVR